MPKSTRQSDTAFAIVLFTDMVGSTAIASELGDRRWRVLQAKHHSVVRNELRSHGGREIDTAGDGFFAAFSEGEAAVRCACAIRDAVMEIGLQVRCGLNVGQVEMNDGKPTGAAVVAAARIMSNAGDSEVLVSNVLRELIPGSKIEFADAGTHELKGLDGSWHLFRVVAVDGPLLAATPPIEEMTTRRTSMADSMVSETSSVSRTKKLLAGAVALLILAAGISFLRRDNDGTSTIASNSIGILDPESGDVTGTIGLEERPGSVAASADAVWVTNPDVGTVTRIDPTEQEVRDSIEVGENPTGIAVGGGAVWVVNSGGPSVSRINPRADEVVDTIAVGNGPAGIAFGEGSVWVTNRFDGTISRIDPDGEKDVKTIPVGLDPRGIAVGFGDVWVGLAGSNTVMRVDAETNDVKTQIGVGNAPGALAVSLDSVWVANTLSDTVSQIDPETNSVIDTVAVGDGPSGISVVDGIVWVANEADGTLSWIEPGQTPVRPLAIGSVPQGLAGVNSDLWVSVRGTATSHRGGTLRLVSDEPPLGGLDPRATYYVESWRLLHLIGDGLVAFEPIGGANPTLVADLATAIPTPTDGGRTYRFELRDGTRYSNGEVVAAIDFRRALEQGFQLNRSAHKSLYGGLVGGEACGNRPATCDLSEGIETDDASRTITFHLVAPDPDFLNKLTLPFAYPVPPSVPDEEQAAAGVPGTGPYKLEGPMTDEGLALKRNPYFHVWSSAAQPEGFVDRLELTLGVQPREQVDAVAAGDADVAFDAYLAPDRLEDLFVRSSAQVHTAPKATTYFVVFNTETPPFDNVDVRRALNLAFDRKQIVQIMGGEAAARPTCQQLPPNFPGYEPYCPYTKNPGPEGGEGPWVAPDLEEAQEIVRRSGTTGMRVVFEYEDPAFAPWGLPLGHYLIGLLDKLGYHGIVKAVSGNALSSPGHEFQMVFSAWGADYLAASNFIVPFHTCGASLILLTGFCDPGIDAMIDRASGLQLEDPVASGALWADIDHAIVNQAPYLWLANPIAVEFVSERVSNYQWSLQWGSLLNQLWVQ
jgi:peptide/nickel transport system substrate-binding protein